MFYGTNPTHGQGGISDQNYAAYRESAYMTVLYEDPKLPIAQAVSIYLLNNPTYIVDAGNMSQISSNSDTSNNNFGLCQDGGCFDPIDFNRDSAETVYKKLIKNIGNLIRLRNEAIAKGAVREVVYITDLISETSDIVGYDTQIKKRKINYDGGNIEIVANLGKGERVTTVHSRRPYKGTGKVWIFEFQVLGEGRNKLKNQSGTFFKPELLQLIFRNQAQYNRFITNINNEANE